MRRQEIQLLAAARQGSTAACCEVGRRYLLGVDGFPRHAGTGLDYLSRPGVRKSTCAVMAIADGLALHEALDLDQLDALTLAARNGHPWALCKLGAWHLTRRTGLDEALRCLRLAVAAGSDDARRVLANPCEDSLPVERAARLLERLHECGVIDAPSVLSRAMLLARSSHDLDGLHWRLGLAARWRQLRCAPAEELVVDAIEMAERSHRPLDDLPIEFVADALERRSRSADARAQFALGRLLCGIPCGALAPGVDPRGLNLRRGTALLLRAADAGKLGAWIHLHRLSSDHRSSVANPAMARFFLEKAAAQGDAESQRRLGALLLREASGIDESEQALGWLHRASRHGDPHARRLLESLVLPVPGDSGEAQAALTLICGTNPRLAARLEVSRHFGLTRLEGLSMDPMRGLRPWGLVVGPNRFVCKSRLAAPRAVPALGEPAAQALRVAAHLFATPERDDGLRTRTRELRRLCSKHGIDDSMFFAAATADALAALRSGTRWAFKHRDALRSALLLPT